MTRFAYSYRYGLLDTPSISSLNLKDDLDDKTVEDFIYGNTSSMSSAESSKEDESPGQPYSPDDDEFLEIPSSAGLPPGIDWRDEGPFHGQESYSSFGEKGTTATVSAYGNILQISKYLDTGTSGIFCADPCISEPWSIRTRLKQLLDLSKGPAGGFGLCLAPQPGNPKPRLQFLHNRWPRFTHNIGDLSISVQYFVNRETVIQKFLFKRKQADEIRKGIEETDAQPSEADDDDVSKTLHHDGATESHTGARQPQENQIQEDPEQTHSLPRGYTQENQAEQRETQERVLRQGEPQWGGTLSNTPNRISVKECLKLETLLQIRESEWVNGSNQFNEEDADDFGYQIATGQNQYSLVVRHQLPAAEEAVALVIAGFINNHPTKITKTPDGSGGVTYGIQLDSEDIRVFDEGGTSGTDKPLEITAAYDLRLITRDCSWHSTLIPSSKLDLNHLMSQNSYHPHLSLSPSAHLDFIMKRNLEHILSVCSIPVPVRPTRKENVESAEESREGIEKSTVNPVALTCGDISGHLVLVSASFFAFQFLLTMYSNRQIQRYPKMAERIFETLKGHLEWVFLHVARDPEGQFLAGYWANGRGIKRLGDRRIPSDTALQIIKARDFVSKCPSKVPNWFLMQVRGFFEEWIQSLRKSDNRDYCVFPRVVDSSYGESGYFLRDHVLIWKALGMLKELQRLELLSGSFVRHIHNQSEQEISLGIYTSEEARRRILKRFTTENPETNERMFAIYRGTQRNSFLLDTTNTILFYDERQFFESLSQNPSKSRLTDGSKAVLDEWIRTTDVQTRHEGVDDKYWQEPLQYGLAMQMEQHGYQINTRPARDMFDEALRVLLQSCSSSGIFPGFLDCETKLSGIFNIDFDSRGASRDSYWNTSFELPYILWMYAKERLERTNDEDKKQAPTERSAAVFQKRTASQAQSQTSQPNSDQRLIPKLLRANATLEDQDFTDQKNVFEISDEWLARCPKFLHFDPQITFADFVMTNAQQKPSIAGSRRLVIDIPKRRNQTDNQTLVDPQPCTSEEFFDRLRQWRTKRANMLIKKRIIWLSSGDNEAAAICPTMVPESEQLALTGFFGRHNNWDKHFLDDPSASTNSWKTEFQLSFYQLGDDKREQGAQSKPEIALAKRIRRGSMGFRFYGDFFDCYWTCHIITSVDRKSKGKEDQDAEVNKRTREVETLLNNFLSRKVGSSKLAVPESGSKKRAWHQRKVLELILFEETIKEVTAGTQEILEEINKVLASATQSGLEDNDAISDLPDKIKETVLFSKIDSNAYFSFSSQWEVLQQILQVLNEDFSDTFKRISSWQSREESRGKETPRWTKKDERRYRPALRRMQISNSESVRELQQLQEKAQALRSSLINRRDYIRDDLNLRGAENTRYFTYVTVVFLPLGFATGIFSMSETPAGTTLARMSGTAATTFVLTVIALYFVADVLEVLKKWKAALPAAPGRMKAALTTAPGRAKEQLRQLSLLLPIANLLLGALRELISNMFHNQHPSSSDGDTDRRALSESLGGGDVQDPPAGDLESQSGPRSSCG